jgi:hypothetical protein
MASSLPSRVITSKLPRLSQASNPIYQDFFEHRSWITPKTIFAKGHPDHFFRQKLVVSRILGQRVVSSKPIFRPRNDIQVFPHTRSSIRNFHASIASNAPVCRAHGGSDVYYLTFLEFPGSSKSTTGLTLRQAGLGMKFSAQRAQSFVKPVAVRLIESFRNLCKSDILK